MRIIVVWNWVSLSPSWDSLNWSEAFSVYSAQGWPSKPGTLVSRVRKKNKKNNRSKFKGGEKSFVNIQVGTSLGRLVDVIWLTVEIKVLQGIYMCVYKFLSRSRVDYYCELWTISLSRVVTGGLIVLLLRCEKELATVAKLKWALIRG